MIGLPLRQEDFQELRLLFQDPRVMRYLGGPKNDDFCHSQLRGQLRQWKANGFGIWVFRERAGNGFVGICAFFQARYLGVREISFGYMLMPQYWHRGLATEMARAVLGIAFGQYRVSSVIADIHHHNCASRRVAIRLGFHFEANATLSSQPSTLYRATRYS
jgi:ribosomal-protein-alanine N-acetyltransferase